MVILGFVLVGWYQFWQFVMRLVQINLPIRNPSTEHLHFWFCSHRLPDLRDSDADHASFERRTAHRHREVLLTVLVSESTVVLSKFFAALIFFMLGAATWGVNFIALLCQEAFDYRPPPSFFITLGCTGAGFLASVCFSKWTKNQIIAAGFDPGGDAVGDGIDFSLDMLPPPWTTASCVMF